MSLQLAAPQVLDALLKHPSFTEDQQIYCTLLATARAVQAAVKARCSGQLTVQLTAAGRQRQKVLHFAAWLREHAPLVRRIDLQLSLFEERQSRHPHQVLSWSNELTAVTAALQQAVCCRAGFSLQQPSLRDVPVPVELPGVLPASLLTSLQCNPDVIAATESAELADAWCRNIRAITLLSQLRELDISSSGPYYRGTMLPGRDVFKDLTCLQHLSKLQLGDARPCQLSHLPPNLKELQAAAVVNSRREAEDLAQWLREHATLLTQFKIAADPLQRWLFVSDLVLESATQQALGTALSSAALTVGGQLQLQHLTVAWLSMNKEFYQQVANSCRLQSLTYLSRNRRAEADSSEAFGVVCTMTTLEALTFPGPNMDCENSGVGVRELHELSGMTGLTKLCFESDVGESQVQLAYLPDGVKELIVDPPYEKEHHPGIGAWALGHLTSTTRLEIPYLTNGCADVLPPNVVELKVRVRHTSLQPLLQLHKLQTLDISESCYDDNRMVPIEQLLSLTCLSNLTSLSLSLSCVEERHQLGTQHVAAWAALPLQSLTIKDSYTWGVPDCVIMAFNSLHAMTKLDLTCHLSGHGLTTLLCALPLCTQLQVLKLHIKLVREKDGADCHLVGSMVGSLQDQTKVGAADAIGGGILGKLDSKPGVDGEGSVNSDSEGGACAIVYLACACPYCTL